MPTMATVDDAMAWWISTPGKSKLKSPFMWQKVEKGRARVELARMDPSQFDRSRSLYVEFSIPLESDIYDPTTWWLNMPAVGYTQPLETIQGFADSMDEPEFRRAFGCQWGDDFSEGEWKVPKATSAPTARGPRSASPRYALTGATTWRQWTTARERTG
jgi:hypothetical protein